MRRKAPDLGQVDRVIGAMVTVNSYLCCIYFAVAAYALGLDCIPISAVDLAKVSSERS